jgi:hypothetical protein
MLLLTQAAPLPPPKPAVFKPGEYELAYHGMRYRAVFRPGGDYEAHSRAGFVWVGVWTFEGGTLRVGESVRPDVGEEAIRPLEWPCRWEWKLGADGPITLRRLR